MRTGITKGVAALLVAGAVVGCTSPEVGVSRHRKTYSPDDAGMSMVDDGGTPVVELDAGTPEVDAGPHVDAGTPEVDAGTPEADAGTPGEGPACTLTPGYWKNHPEAWPVESLELGGVVYSKAELMALLDARVRGDASRTLARHLIAALLNGGASDPAIASVIVEAHAWLAANADADGRLPFGTAPGSAAHVDATDVALDLAAYNEGSIGPGHCD